MREAGPPDSRPGLPTPGEGEQAACGSFCSRHPVCLSDRAWLSPLPGQEEPCGAGHLLSVQRVQDPLLVLLSQAGPPSLAHKTRAVPGLWGRR